jgi:hypothetical protein
MARYGGRRTVAPGRLLDTPFALSTMGELTAMIGAVEAFKDEIAGRLDAGEIVPAEVPMAAKVVGSEGLNWAAGRLLQMLGGRGYMANNLAPQILRDARVLSVGEGPNEPLTTQVGRKARLTGAIADYLAASPGGDVLAETLGAAAAEVESRWLARADLAGGRSAAQLWADALIGELAVDALLLAATRGAKRRSPSDRLRLAADWAELRFDRTLRRACEGAPEERLVPAADAIEAAVACYAEAIGDVEQSLAGEEEALDHYLCKVPGSDPYPPVVDLPGSADVAGPTGGRRPPRPRTGARCWPRYSSAGSRRRGPRDGEPTTRSPRRAAIHP